MHIIIKGVETIEEYKQCYALMHGMADEFRKKHNGCLLYTSDAADEL